MYKARKSREANRACVKDYLKDTLDLTKVIRLPTIDSLRIEMEQLKELHPHNAIMCDFIFRN